MRLTSLVRRSVAVTTATALITGGLASGFLAAPAFAAGEQTISYVSPGAVINSSTGTVYVNGANFVPNTASVYFEPLFTGEGVARLQGTVVTTPETPTLTNPTPPPPSTPTQLKVTADFTRLAPGAYTVRVDQTTPGSPPTVTTALCTCFSITSQGPATAGSAVKGTTPSNKVERLTAPLTISGSNIAKGATVEFLRPDGSVDPALQFLPGWADGATAGYESFTVLRGSYTYVRADQPAFTPGRHLISLKNTDQPYATPTLEFYQPLFESGGVVPNNLGQGANQQVVTVTGRGFRPDSKIEIDGHSPSSSCASDLTVGTASFSESAGTTTLSAPVSIAVSTSSCTYATGARKVGVRGPDGGYYSVAGAFTVNAAPKIDSTGISPKELGQGGTRAVVVTGTGFTPATVFTFSSSKVTAVTTGVTGTTSAAVTVTAAPDAIVENLAVTVTNPSDRGSTTYPASDAKFAIKAGPRITALPTPSSTGLGTTSRTITVKGTNFDPSMFVTLYKGKDASGNPVPSPDARVINVVVTKPGLLDPAGDTLTFQVQVDAGAAPGLRDLYLENNGNKGAYLCVQCFGIDSLALSPNAGSNTGVYTLTVIGQGVRSDGTSRVELIRVNAPAAEAHIVGSWVASTLTDADTSQARATFDLKDAAPGPYNGVVQVDPTTQLSCSSCFTIAGQAPTITAVAPNQAGQGATGVPITVTGTTFSRGMILSIPDVSVRNVTFVDSTRLTALVDVDPNAATGAKTVTVTNADGAKSAALASGFTVNAGPKPTAANNGANAATWGQGAGKDGSKQTITVTGTGFVKGANPETSSTLALGEGIAVSNVAVASATSLTADLVVAYDAPTGFHNVVVTNPDKGAGTLSGKLEIKAGPKPTSVSPAALRPGAADQSLVISGSGFNSGSTVSIEGLTLTNTTVNGDGTQIVVTAKVNSDATLGYRNIVVTNGTDKGTGSCVGCFLIANPPGVPQGVTATGAAQSINVSWTVPASNGGAPITKYVVSALRSGTTAPVTVESTTLSATVAGLVNGATYAVRVLAVNAAGPGAASAPVSAIPGAPVTLTLVPSTRLVLSGNVVTLRGKLSGSGTGLAGRTVKVLFAPAVGNLFTKTVTTDSTGAWSLRYAATYNFKTKASYAGDATYRSVSTVPAAVNATARVRVISPGSSSTSSATSRMRISGTVSPNKRGTYVYLYRYINGSKRAVARAVVTSSSTFAFVGTPPRGNYTFRVFIGTTKGNAAGYSAAFIVRRV